MKIFLCSDTIYPNIQKDFEEFVLKKINQCTVSFVTSAANPEKEKSWMYEDIEYAKKLFQSVQLYDIEEMSLNDMVSEFTKRDILWFNGGNTSYLMKKVRESGLESKLPSILKKTIYVGSSAGSMIWSKSLRVAQWYPDGPEPGAEKVPGMGLLSFQIYPHYKESSLDVIKKNKKKEEEFWLLKNEQAISYHDKVIVTYGGNISILPREI